jgi:FkbM family methyltransferase
MISIAKNILKRISQGLSRNKQSGTIEIQLNGPRGTLYFEAFSPVEHYRIAHYGDEEGFLNFFLSKIISRDVVFDIGASVGLFSIHAASILDQGRVIAFEPDGETLERLKHNVKLNIGLSNVGYISWAVSNIQSEATLYTDGASGCAPSLKKQPGRTNAPKGKIRIQTNTLDHAIANGELPLPTVLKIDIEGAEILCLKGAQRLLKGAFGKKPRLIFLEAHPDFLTSFDSNVEEVNELIADNGYTVIWTQERDNQIHYCYLVN